MVTLLGVVMMVMGGLGLPISAITVLMYLAGSYGTQNAPFWEACLIMLGPLVLVVTGLGLLRRWRWAWFVALAILVGVMIHQAGALMRGPQETKTHTTESGVRVTVTGSGPSPSAWPILLVSGALAAGLFSARVRAEFRKDGFDGKAREAERDWRVGHLGRDRICYEERHHGEWQRLEIDGEMLMGEAGHAVYFASPEAWRSYPEWARERRDEIVARVSAAMREEAKPRQGSGHAGATANQTATTHLGGRTEQVTFQQRVAIALVILFFGAVAGWMGWLVKSGIDAGETTMPGKRASLRRVVKREEEPASFWAALSVYALLGAASGAGAAWFLRETWRLRTRHDAHQVPGRRS